MVPPAPSPVPAGTLVGDVARRVLRERLQAVARAAEAVASGEPTGAAIHRLRVSTRRAAATLFAYRPLVPRRQRRWFQRSLRRIRRTVGETRDLDVIIAGYRPAAGGRGTSRAARVARQRLVEILAKHRLQAGRGLSGLVPDGWAAHSAAVLAAVQTAGATEAIGSYTPRRSRRLFHRYLDRCDRRLRGGRGIHRLRIETKKLRYVLEALAAGMPDAGLARGDRMLHRLQVRLGAFTDRAAAADRLAGWSRREEDDRARELLAKACRREFAAAARARRECIRWWESSRRDRLVRRLNRFLGGKTA